MAGFLGRLNPACKYFSLLYNQVLLGGSSGMRLATVQAFMECEHLAQMPKAVILSRKKEKKFLNVC
jgi:hypothetical protein